VIEVEMAFITRNRQVFGEYVEVERAT